MRPYLSTTLRVLVFLFLLLFSAAVLLATAQYTYSARNLALQALESTALALSSAAEDALRQGGKSDGDKMRQVLSDRVLAYALIAGKDGKILFHTNPGLVGFSLPGEEVSQLLQSKKASGCRITLGTGLPAYRFDYPLNLRGENPELLRLVLHTSTADRIVSSASRMWWAVGVVLVLLWAAGFMLEKILTRHLRLQAEMARKEQLALIGQMTAVLAHEIRNALGSIKGYAQWVDEKTTPSDSIKEGMAMVIRGAARIESLVHDLLLFSREETYHLKACDIAHCIQEALDCTVPPWEGAVELKMRPELFAIADRDKLLRVMINGIRNAIQAMGDDDRLRVSAFPRGRWVEIQIEDTGPGIPEAELPRLFTPFHTTKADGTGLGLAYSMKVIEGMGGNIRLFNQREGMGAILTLRLPKARGL